MQFSFFVRYFGRRRLLLNIVLGWSFLELYLEFLSLLFLFLHTETTQQKGKNIGMAARNEEEEEGRLLFIY